MPPRKKNVVSNDRKESMALYNSKLTDEIKNQYKMNKILKDLATGKQKHVRKSTINNPEYNWGDQLPYLKSKLLPSIADRRKNILADAPQANVNNDYDDDEDDDEEPEPEPEPEHEAPIDYAKLLHCKAVKAYLGSRSNYKAKNITDKGIAGQTKTMDESNATVVCRIYKTEDFRKILNDTADQYFKKLSTYKIPNGKSIGRTYSASTLKKKLGIIFILLNEYEPAISYIKNKTTHDFEKYYSEMEKISGLMKRQSQTDTINRTEARKTTQDEIYNNLKQLFNIETIMKPDRMTSLSNNLHYIEMLLYTQGCFEKTMKLENIRFVPRLDFDEIKLVSNAKQKFQGDGKYYNTKTGRLYLKGKDSSKTAYLYDYILTKYVQKEINASIKKYPRENLLDTYTDSTIGRVFKDMLRKHTTNTTQLKTNTDYRHLFETVYSILKIDTNIISAAIGHQPMTGKGIYKASVIDQYDEAKTKLLDDLFKSLKK